MPTVLLPGYKNPPTPFRPETVPVTLGGKSGVSSFGSQPAQTTIRYVRKSGSNANGGTSPSDAWLTLAFALANISPGSILYIGAGTYRETIGNLSITPTFIAPVTVVGDVDGTKTGDVGPVIITAYTTGDVTAPSASTILSLNAKSNITFRNLVFIGGSQYIITATTLTSQNISFQDCAFIGGADGTGGLIDVNCGFGIPLRWRFDRCFFLTGNVNGAILIQPVTGVGLDYDIDLQINDCIGIQAASSNSQFMRVVATGGGAAKPGGLKIRNMFFIGGVFLGVTATSSTNIPTTCYSCVLYCGSAFTASNLGLIVEDYNVIISNSPRSSVGVGSHSPTNIYAPLFHIGQERIWGAMFRALGEPMAGSPILAAGVFDTLAGPLDNAKRVRPSSPTSWAAGALERGNNYSDETSTVNTGSNAISVIGSGSEEFDMEVDAGPITISVYCQFDSNYVGPLPELQIINATQVGVGDSQVSVSNLSNGAFSQVSLTVNPTSSGTITVRVCAHDTSEISKTTFDTFAVA